jgi:hypothetical protein
LIRALFRFIDGFFFGIPAAVTMRPPLQQRHGDRAAKTLVIRHADVAEAVRRPWWRLLAASGLHFAVATALFAMTVYAIGTQAVEALPDLSEAILTATDLPNGFMDVPPEMFGLGEGGETLGGDVMESVFAVWCEEPTEMIWGFTVLLPTKADRAQADEDMHQTEALLTEISQGLGATGMDILEQPRLSGFKTVGDTSVELTMVVDVEGTPMRLDMYSFRRGAAGAYLFAMYPNNVRDVSSCDSGCDAGQ